MDQLSHIGISSFGFGGSNAHIVIKGVEEQVRKKVEDFEIPFDRSRSSFLKEYYRVDDSDTASGELASDNKPQGEIISEDVSFGIPGNDGLNKKMTRKEVQKLVEGFFSR